MSHWKNKARTNAAAGAVRIRPITSHEARELVRNRVCDRARPRRASIASTDTACSRYPDKYMMPNRRPPRFNRRSIGLPQRYKPVATPGTNSHPDTGSQRCLVCCLLLSKSLSQIDYACNRSKKQRHLMFLPRLGDTEPCAQWIIIYLATGPRALVGVHGEFDLLLLTRCLGAPGQVLQPAH
jgi:hypothetical protein